MTHDRDSAVQRLRLAYATGHLYLRDLYQRLERLEDPDLNDVDYARITAGLPAAPSHRAVAGRHKPYPLDIGVLDELHMVANPVERIKRAAAIAGEQAELEETARRMRNEALVSAHVRYQVPQAQCYEAVGMLRRPYRNAVRRRPANLPDYGSGGESIAVGVEWDGKYRAARSAAQTARLVRDVGIRTVIDGKEVTNAGIARELGMTTERIAQIKTDDIAA